MRPVARTPRVAVVDYGMGNLYSVQRACVHAGADAVITAMPEDVASADGVVLPGVGAMPDAMRVLAESGLDRTLREVIARGTPFLGICLGMQLLMREGSEFCPHAGLGVIEGTVARFEGREPDGTPLRVPHIGWNAVRRLPGAPEDAWANSPLKRCSDGAFLYFVHSYYVVPDDGAVCVAATAYGGTDFCCALQRDNVFACQFHPERSGPQGLVILRNFVASLASAAAPPGR